MKALVLSLLMTVFMLTSNSKAAYSIYRYDVYIGSYDQTKPDIDGDIVTWQSGDTDIYYKIADFDSVRLELAGTQTDPKVSNGVLVWYDNNGNRNIYGYKVQEDQFLHITDNSIRQWQPDISGSIVVWNESANIYSCNISQALYETVCDNDSDQYYPAIDGNTIVWMDNRDGGAYQIYMADVSGTSPYTAQRVGTSGNDQWFPDISGDWIVWEEKLTSDNKTIAVFAYNKQTGATWSHTITATVAINAYPCISDGIVVWQEYNAGDYAIWAKDLTDMGADAFEVSDGTGTNELPAISGNTIVWQHNNSTHYDIAGAKLLDPSTLTVTYPKGGESIDSTDPMTITWASTGPVDDVLIEFSSDGGAHWADVNTVPDTGIYEWDPIADVDSTDCWIRITNPYDPAATDTSDAAFEIYQIPNSITIATPAGGEQYLAAKSPMDITWASVGEIADVTIEFTDDGLNWQQVTATTANDGQYTWNTVPDVDSQVCHIRVSDVADPATRGLSNVFTIFQCDQALTADLTGDCMVNLADVAELSRQWLDCGNPYNPAWCPGN